MLPLTLTFRFFAVYFKHRHDDGGCARKAGTNALVGEADAPSHNYDATGRRGTAADFLLGKSNDGRVPMYII
jgi:hypothetical protein